VVGESGPGADHVAKIESTAGRMRLLINDLLAFSRLLRTEPTFVGVDLGVVLRQVTADLEGVIAETRGRVVVSDLPTIDGYSAQLRQLFTNLVGNALKFHKPGIGSEVTVASRLFESEHPAAPGVAAEWCEITVKDDGIGFDTKYLDRIFKIFERLHSREAFEGTGIGLAICRRVVERHAGTITATSTVGMGATFVVRLPLHQPESPAVSAR
jgi:signal transduction histidine kinase